MEKLESGFEKERDCNIHKKHYAYTKFV